MKAIKDKFSVSIDWQGEIASASIRRNLPVAPYSDVFKKMKDSSNTYMVTFYKRLSKAVDNLTNAVNVESDHDAGICTESGGDRICCSCKGCCCVSCTKQTGA